MRWHVVGCAGRSPAAASSSSSSSTAGHDGPRVAEQLVHGAGLHAGVDAPLFDGRTHDEGAVTPGHEVDGMPAHQAADRTA